MHNRIYTNHTEKSNLGGGRMQSKRKRILTMLENGTITTEEALTLLEKISNDQSGNQEEVQQPKEEKSQQVEERFQNVWGGIY